MEKMMCSHSVGPTLPALIEETIGRVFDRTVQQHADREALVVPFQSVRWTWREFGAKVDAVAAGLLSLGLAPCDRVGIWSPNNAEWAVVQFATAKAGLVLVNINPAYRSAELSYALNKVGCKALIMAPSLKSSNYLEILASIAPELAGSVPGELASAALPALRWVIRLGEDVTPGMLNFSALAERAEPAHHAQLAQLAFQLSPHDPINIQFTSGTTGHPKGATLTHRNIVNNGFFVGEAIRLTPQDRLCVPVPLYHCFGMVMANLGCVTHGATLVYPAEVFSPQSVLEAVAAERCTALYGVPTMFIALLDHPAFASFDLGSLRTGIMAGSPCPIEVMRRVISHMHMAEVTIAYGMTETSPVSTQSAVDDPIERRVTTVGRVQPHLEVKILDGEGRVVPCGTAGELCTRGYSVMNGYWDDLEKTAEAVDAEGWMHTGDLATMDEEGYVQIVGRLKDMVIRGGENVYPREVEEHLFRHPKVQDAQVVGVPDSKYGEELCAWIRVKAGQTLTEDEVRAHCRAGISHYKVPRYVLFVDDYPMTITGKVQKFIMRKEAARLLGLD